MKLSLMKKLSFGFLTSVIISLMVASFISNYMINNRFNSFLVNQHDMMVKNIVGVIDKMYNNEAGQLIINADELSRYANMQQLFIEVKNTSGKIIYSSGSSHLQNNNMMKSMMGSHMMGISGMSMGDYREDNFPLLKGSVNIGSAVIGYYGYSYINSDAMAFKSTLNRSFIFSAVIALILGLTMSLVISRQLSSPLLRIIRTANTMRNGDLAARLESNSGTLEIDQLSDSINYLAETLEKQEMLRKRLTSDMAHEIRTPLTTLKTHVEAMLDGIWEPTPSRLEIFYNEITRLTKLVDNLRNLAKLENTTLQLNKTAFSLSQETENIIDNFTPLFSKAGYKLLQNISPDINVVMDKDKYHQILHNLLSNSYKYLDNNGIAEVTLQKDKENIILKVWDNGIGIAKVDLPHIFERFYRSDLSRSKDTGGAGIGLTITKALVEALGGRIHANSSPSKGTVFIVTFPVDAIDLGNK